MVFHLVRIFIGLPYHDPTWGNNGHTGTEQTRGSPGKAVDLIRFIQNLGRSADRIGDQASLPDQLGIQIIQEGLPGVIRDISPQPKHRQEGQEDIGDCDP
jgi:hypothetical protein